MNRRQFICGVVAVTTLGVAACQDNNPDATVSAIEAAIAYELPVGSPTSAIQDFCRKWGLRTDWLPYSQAYGGVIPKEWFRSVRVLLFVDGQGRFSHAEVRYVYTFL